MSPFYSDPITSASPLTITCLPIPDLLHFFHPLHSAHINRKGRNMITEYEMYVQLDHYPEQRSDCRLNHDHPIINFTAPMHHVSDPGSNRNHEADLISDPNREAIAASDESFSREPQIRLMDPSSGKSGTRKRKNYRPQHQKDFAKRRTRHNFSSCQTKALEESFDLVTHYPDFNAMDELSQSLELPVERIQVWFQNRRAKFRRNTACKSASSR